MAQTLVIDGLKRRTLPINLRQSGNSDAQMLISARIRKSPWWHLSKAAGCWAYTTYNHMYHPPDSRRVERPRGYDFAHGLLGRGWV